MGGVSDRGERYAAYVGSSSHLPPGNCGVHGYHGCVTCPRCSTSAISPARIVAPTQPPPKPSDARASVEIAVRDHLVAERDTLAEAMRLLDLAIGGHTRGCDAPDDSDCPRCVWDSEWSRYREVRDAR